MRKVLLYLWCGCRQVGIRAAAIGQFSFGAYLYNNPDDQVNTQGLVAYLTLESWYC